MSKPVVLFLASIDWDFLFQRVQHLAQQFARGGYQVYYRNPGQKRGVPPKEIEKNLFLCTDLDLVDKSDWVHVIYLSWYPGFHSWLDTGKNSLIIYDCVDDFEEHDPHQEEMLAKSDLVFTTAIRLYDELQKKHDDVYLIPNGVPFDHFNKKCEIPEDMKNISKPIIGFVGALNPRWVDVKVLDQLIAKNPQWSFVFVGTKVGMKAYENVHFLGVKSYKELPDYITNFDVTLIPFLDNRISRAANPIKMYEYLAAGKPIIARRLPETEKVKEIYLYSSESEAEEAIKKALLEEGTNQERYRKIAMEHTWEQRFKKMDDIIRKKMEEKEW